MRPVVQNAGLKTCFSMTTFAVTVETVNAARRAFATASRAG
jgi:hypothetical protein